MWFAVQTILLKHWRAYARRRAARNVLVMPSIGTFCALIDTLVAEKEYSHAEEVTAFALRRWPRNFALRYREIVVLFFLQKYGEVIGKGGYLWVPSSCNGAHRHVGTMLRHAHYVTNGSVAALDFARQSFETASTSWNAIGYAELLIRQGELGLARSILTGVLCINEKNSTLPDQSLTHSSQASPLAIATRIIQGIDQVF